MKVPWVIYVMRNWKTADREILSLLYMHKLYDLWFCLSKQKTLWVGHLEDREGWMQVMAVLHCFTLWRSRVELSANLLLHCEGATVAKQLYQSLFCTELPESLLHCKRWCILLLLVSNCNWQNLVSESLPSFIIMIYLTYIPVLIVEYQFCSLIC